jgi:hypothetical protein
VCNTTIVTSGAENAFPSKSNLNMMNIYEESTLNFWICVNGKTDNTMAERKGRKGQAMI